MSAQSKEKGHTARTVAPESQHLGSVPCSDSMECSKKRLENLRARCALVGVELYATTDDQDRPLYIGCKWAQTKGMSDLDQVAAWVRLLDGRAEQ